MAQFVGTWVDDKNAPVTNYDELMDKIGMGADKDKYRDSVSTIVYERDGKKWKVTASNDAFPGEPRVYSFEEGVPFDDFGLDGKPFKATINVMSDTDIKESGTSEDYGEFVTLRKVEGDRMKVSVTGAGVTMTSEMKRVK